MKKKTLILLSLISVLTLSACGATVPEDISPSAASTASTEQTQSDTATAETENKEQKADTKETADIDELIANAGKSYEKYIDDGVKALAEQWNSVDAMAAPAKGLSGFGLFSNSTDEAVSVAAESVAAESVESRGEASDFVNPDVIWDTEGYKMVDESGFVSVQAQPFSTFGADTDTAIYSGLRREILGSDYEGYGVDSSSIRIEEMINYFKYQYEGPQDGEKFGVTTTLNPCPWNEDTLLLKVGIKTEEAMPVNGSNIVFLIDTSGSMYDFDRLPLVQEAFKTLTDSLNENDKVSIVTYAGSSDVLARGISGNEHEKIKKLIDSLEADGATNGADGIVTAYDIAREYFIEGGNNRVILATDGDLNVGVTSEAGLIDLIEKEKESGVMLSCLGFGIGNYKDDKMEALADHGNGNYAYIDCPDEANRVLKDEIWSTLYTVAKDTKFQVEFNPETVKGYRLIGYENRKMAAEDFADDTKDGGEIGQNQCVTVLYEIVPSNSNMDMSAVSSKYQQQQDMKTPGPDDELLTVNIRYKEPDQDESKLKTYPVTYGLCKEQMDADTSWAAGVAQFGMLLRNSKLMGTTTYDGVYDRLKQLDDVTDDTSKLEFLYMVKKVAKDPGKFGIEASVSEESTDTQTSGYSDYYGITDENGNIDLDAN